MGVCEHISLPEHLLLSKHKRVPCSVPKKEANLQSEQLPTPNNSERENSEWKRKLDGGASSDSCK